MGDNRILQGTTPYLACHFKPDKLDVSRIIALELTMRQFKTYCPTLMFKKIDDCTIDTEHNVILYHFTESETLNLSPKVPLEFQYRFLIDGEKVGTRVKEIKVDELLSGKVFEL